MLYVNLIVTTEQKPTVGPQKIKRRESKDMTAEKSTLKGRQQEKKNGTRGL